MGNLSAPFAYVERETNLLLLSNLVKHPILAYLLFFLFLLFLPPPVDKGGSLRRAMSPVMSRRGERVCCGKGRIGGAIRGAGDEIRQQVDSNLHAQKVSEPYPTFSLRAQVRYSANLVPGMHNSPLFLLVFPPPLLVFTKIDCQMPKPLLPPPLPPIALQPTPPTPCM